MLEIEAERRLETVAVIGLNVTDPLVCFVAPAGYTECATAPEPVDEQPRFRVPVRRHGLTRGPVAQQDWSLHGERGRSGSYRGA